MVNYLGFDGYDDTYFSSFDSYSCMIDFLSMDCCTYDCWGGIKAGDLMGLNYYSKLRNSIKLLVYTKLSSFGFTK